MECFKYTGLGQICTKHNEWSKNYEKDMLSEVKSSFQAVHKENLSRLNFLLTI